MAYSLFHATFIIYRTTPSLESEYHFLLVCPLYGDIRRQFLTRTAWPSVAKFLNIMSAQTNSFLKKLSKVIQAANITRSEALARLAAS